MRSRLGQWASLSFALAMAGAVLLGPATKARATLTLEAQETTGATVNATLIAQDNTAAGTGSILNFFGAPSPTTATASDTDATVGSLALGSTTVPITFGDFSVLGSVSTSNSPGDGLAQLISNSLSVTNNSATAHTITLIISDTGFTMPGNPMLTAEANGGFSTVAGSGVTTVLGDSINAKAFASFANTLFGMGVTVQNFSYSAQNLPIDSYNNTTTSLGGSSAVPYSMTVELVFTLQGHTILTNRGDAITASPIVPEPATLAMAFSVLPLIGFAAWRKRRQSA
jgi:hypothetical protein